MSSHSEPKTHKKAAVTADEQTKVNYDALLALVAEGAAKLTAVGLEPHDAARVAFDLLKEAGECKPFPKPDEPEDAAKS